MSKCQIEKILNFEYIFTFHNYIYQFNYENLLEFSLESVNGGISLFINLMLNKELSGKREQGNYQCGGCGRQYNQTNLIYKNNNVYWPATFPENGICGDVRISYIVLNFMKNIFRIN